MFPVAVVLDLKVIPTDDDVLAIVSSSAPPTPGIVVPMATWPADVMRSLSLVLAFAILIELSE